MDKKKSQRNLVKLDQEFGKNADQKLRTKERTQIKLHGRNWSCFKIRTC